MSEQLLAADLSPVCAPHVAERLKEPSDLSAATLLRVAHADEDWGLWLNAAGVSQVTAKGAVFDYYGQALQAATDGVGVAVGIRPYIDDDLRAGRLVMPFPMTVPKGQQWYLIYREIRRDQPDFVSFRDWILAAASLSPAVR